MQKLFIAAILILAACTMNDVPASILPTSTTIPTIGEPPTAEPTIFIPFTLVPPTETPTPSAPPGAIGPAGFAPNVNPLTGLTVSDPTVLERRPVVAKISNAPPLVRPQSGIGAADLVFEHYAEGGLTRFSAIFYSQMPTRVGSVRSARLIDYELVAMYNALLVYSGASNGVNDLVAQSDFFERTYMGILYGQPYYFRDESIVVPHNMFSNVAAVSQLANAEGLNNRPVLEGLAFHPLPPPSSTGQANTITINYVATQARWDYDPAQGVYRRSSDGLGHYDANTMQQVTAENVVVIYADHTLSNIVESEWQGSVTYGWEIKLWFEGDAVLFRDGQRYEGRWIRPTRESMIALRTHDGQILYLKPGETWFQVVKLPEQQDPAEEGITVE